MRIGGGAQPLLGDGHRAAQQARGLGSVAELVQPQGPGHQQLRVHLSEVVAALDRAERRPVLRQSLVAGGRHLVQARRGGGLGVGGERRGVPLVAAGGGFQQQAGAGQVPHALDDPPGHHRDPGQVGQGLRLAQDVAAPAVVLQQRLPDGQRVVVMPEPLVDVHPALQDEADRLVVAERPSHRLVDVRGRERLVAPVRLVERVHLQAQRVQRAVRGHRHRQARVRPALHAGGRTRYGSARCGPSAGGRAAARRAVAVTLARMEGRSDARLPVPVSAYGPLNALGLQVHALNEPHRRYEALAAADVNEAVARAFGDDKTVGFVLQGRMYVYERLGHYDDALAVGEALLEHHRGSGNVLGEAKTLADLARIAMVAGRIVESMRHLARSGLLLETPARRNERYASALASYAQAATAAGLYEVAAAGYQRLAEYRAPFGPVEGGYYFGQVYAELLMSWALRLDQLGHTPEAASLLRRTVAITEEWLGTTTDPHESREVIALRALAFAKLGQVDQAVALAAAVVVPLRATERHWGAWSAHLALGIALRARGELGAARRELLAARQLSESGPQARERPIVLYELAVLAAEELGTDAVGDLLEALRVQAQQLWQQRLQRLAMLRQARQREELEIERTRAEAALLFDPLTGLGNRRRFDQLMAALDAGQLPEPTGLLVIDVDKFKAVNDTHSHSAGDQVLRELGAVLKASCRAADIPPVRYAGDEFTIFLHADLPTAVAVAERIRIAVASTDFDHVAPGTRVTISIGVAVRRPGMSAAELFHAADTKMYQAKRDGRDRVVA